MKLFLLLYFIIENNVAGEKQMKKLLISVAIMSIFVAYRIYSVDRQLVQKYAVARLVMQKTANYTLLCASEENDFEAVQRALAQGAQVNTYDPYGKTALMHAVINNNIAIATLLLENRAAINQQDNAGNTALHIALLNNNTDMATLLIGYNPNMNITNKNGLTPLNIIQKANLGPKLFGPKNQ